MQEINIKIRGTQPILLHKYNPEEETGGLTKEEKAIAYKTEWMKGVYLQYGVVSWPATNMMQVLFDGARGLNRGKVFFTRILFGCLVVSPLKIPFLVDRGTVTLDKIKKEDWIDITGVKIGTARVNRSRVMLPVGWELDFIIIKQSEELQDEEIKKIVVKAGKAGMGDWRPSAPKKPGPYGTFELVSFG